jgi:hypothetical protein
MTGTKPGRKVLILGSCSDASCLQEQPDLQGPGLDVLVAGALRPGGKFEQEALDRAPGCADLMPATALGKLAARLSARHVLLSRFDWRLHGSEAHPYNDPMTKLLAGQIAARLSPQQRVTAVHDFWVHVLDKHEGGVYRQLAPEGKSGRSPGGARGGSPDADAAGTEEEDGEEEGSQQSLARYA